MYLAILVVVIIFGTRAILEELDPDYGDIKSAIMKATLIKIIIDFVQVLNLASEFDFHWPSEVIILLVNRISLKLIID